MFICTIIQMPLSGVIQMLTCIRIFLTQILSQPQRASTVRVKRPPPVINERTKRRIYNEEMSFGEALASHGQDEQGAEDVRQVPAVGGLDKQDPRGAKQASGGHRQSRVGPEPPQDFLRQVGPWQNQPIVPLWQWNGICQGDPFRPRNIKFTSRLVDSLNRTSCSCRQAFIQPTAGLLQVWG